MAFKTENNPILPASNVIMRLVDEVIELTQERRELEAKLDKKKQAIKKWAKVGFFKYNGKYMPADDPSNVFDVMGNVGKLQLDFVNKYQLNEERLEQLDEILSADVSKTYFHEYINWYIEPTLTELTNSAKYHKFEMDLADLANKYDFRLTKDYTYAVDETFHDHRHTLSLKENQEIDTILPMEIQITT